MRTSFATLIGTGIIGAAALSLGACQRDVAMGAPVSGGLAAVSQLRTDGGADAGRATATEVGGGLRFTIDARNLPPGTHGAHVHMIGDCAPPGFTSAGGHWNPAGARHGSLNPQGPHMGDLPNLVIGTDGRGSLGITVPGATMAGLLDIDGSALIVHSGPDDLMTDPSGNSGARIACGVFQPA